ncbi:uncharacterized protein LOC9629937 [Selaginella moellendorffii]|uniref:uncharacterized protein LOC9629937 n=1 Tax=Selaginella moellendorffii TaxID=88036 RepID=UPI000D1CF816|nr:uncharacterized protein LOC9629937 [Selaginella moellendorffii]|eukprot:XP_024535971.1 uncharacterized protein LOC9629937 [Selaginella moellendorffii]
MAAPIPEEVMEGVSGMDDRLERLEQHMKKLLNSWSPDALALLAPADRASAYMAVSKALNAVYCLLLRTRGECPEDHPVKSELDRVNLYDEKVQYACDRSKAPRPTLSLDVKAANRFIEHGIPDLTEEQKLLVREAGMRTTTKKNNRPRPDHSSSKRLKSGESVADAAAAFLAVASKEIGLAGNEASIDKAAT